METFLYISRMILVLSNGDTRITSRQNEEDRHHFGTHCSDVIMARWRLKSPASQLFTQPFIQDQVKENIKAPHRWLQMASNSENVSNWWRHNEQHIRICMIHGIPLIGILFPVFDCYPSETHWAQISRNLVCPKFISQLWNRFEISHITNQNF